jgi:excisionase family DNA binding protein
MRPLYTIQELANTLRLQPGTVRNKLSRGEDMPRSVLVGRRRLFPEEAVEAWLQAQEARQDAARLPIIKPPAAVLTLLGGHVVLRLFRWLLVGPGAERLAALSTAAIRPRRSHSLEGSRGEEGRIGSWAPPLKRSHACLSSPSSPVA